MICSFRKLFQKNKTLEDEIKEIAEVVKNDRNEQSVLDTEKGTEGTECKE